MKYEKPELKSLSTKNDVVSGDCGNGSAAQDCVSFGIFAFAPPA